MLNSGFCFYSKRSSDMCTGKVAVSYFKMWSEISLNFYPSVRKKNDGDFQTMPYR